MKGISADFSAALSCTLILHIHFVVFYFPICDCFRASLLLFISNELRKNFQLDLKAKSMLWRRIFNSEPLINSTRLICNPSICTMLRYFDHSISFSLSREESLLLFFYLPLCEIHWRSFSGAIHSNDTFHSTKETHRIYQEPLKTIPTKKLIHSIVFNILPFSCNSRYLKCCFSSVNI